MRSSSSEVSSPALEWEKCVSGRAAAIGKLSVLGIPLVEIDIGLLADQIAVSATDTLDLSQGVHDLLLAIDLK